ncbi:MAG: alpha/beta fold hydrolase, partial [Angustibacter sp.]
MSSSHSVVDATHVLHEGDWTHRFISANGARFHLAEAGTGPLIVLLHGFPQFWWTWRALLPALSQAGYRAVALDLRGFGASDKPPRGYDTATLAADVAAVIRSLGAEQAVIIGHDWGAWIAWSMPTLEPECTRAIIPISMAHPLAFARALRAHPAQLHATRHQWNFQLPFRAERRLRRTDFVSRYLGETSGTAWPETDPTAVRAYATALRVPFVAHS